MKHKLLVCSAMAMALSFAFGAHAQTTAQTTTQAVNNTGSSKPTTVTAQAVNNQTAVACNLCFTCGGDWPVFAGAFTPVGANPTERGSACAGALIVRSDSRPFLCCR